MSTPITDAAYNAVRSFANEEQAVDALVEMRETSRKLERENAALRELTSTLGAPNHINVPVEQWRELRADKERLDSGTILLTVDGERVHHVGVNLRDAIDAGRKEAQP